MQINKDCFVLGPMERTDSIVDAIEIVKRSMRLS